MTTGFDGLRVVTFESRLSSEMGGLIERLGGRVRRAPAMRELPIPQSPDAVAFAEGLLAGRFDMVVFLTGTGARALMSVMEQHHPRQAITEALARTVTVARGPKPVVAMREWGLKPNLLAPEPNTWREILSILDTSGPLTGKQIALQEYGEPNPQLLEALRQRGADVTSVRAYTWALPEDLAPLREAIQAIAAGDVDVVVFTSAQQARNLLHVAADMGMEQPLRDGLQSTAIGSIGPTTSQTLHELNLGHDYEPDRTKMSDLVRGLARSAGMLLRRKRASRAAGIDTARAGRIDLLWPADECGDRCDPLHDSVFLRACRREPTEYTPIWLMRQAGRYQREYRDIRSKISFLEMCKRPELAAEVTLLAVEQLGVDAAIIFSDILLMVEPMGLGLAFNKGEGPTIASPVRTGQDVDALRDPQPAQSLSFVYDAIRLARRALHPGIPLIGFCGAPFTVASYMIQGGSSRDFRETKIFMYRDPGAWHALLEKLAVAHAEYLNAQIEAGAQVLQIFDSWVGCLGESDYRRFVLPHIQKLLHAIRPGVPIIHFAANASAMGGAIKEAGGDVIGIDWRMNLGKAWAALGYDVAVQGNLDPIVLFASPSEIRRQAEAIIDDAAGRSGHIFNLGHGILTETPVDHAIALVDAVHEYSAKKRGI